MARTAALLLSLLLPACGSEVIVKGGCLGDGNDADCEGAGGSATPGSQGAGGAGSGPPAVGDGALMTYEGFWRLRLVPFPMNCASSLGGTPLCDWYDLEVLLPQAPLDAGLTIDPGMGLGAFYFNRARFDETGACIGTDSAGDDLLDAVTVGVPSGGSVAVELGPGWSALADELALTYAIADCAP
ncbi:MAG: hypothetical protein R3B72_32155 [Polyangiaceae bacterium]